MGPQQQQTVAFAHAQREGLKGAQSKQGRMSLAFFPSST